ncbi:MULTISPECIES: hypothetical protein [unclassified Sphingopyxis]|jgi:hypothetical protein|uniref:hypothetical protein n=1 Tax=unclassified Sphingopyxis TaxID=2614943 RepID=UPI000A842B5C|nr:MULTISPECIES: hypothetical protein [unclassified Sphingopyxis]
MTQKDIILILAVIGAFAVLGFVLRLAFALLFPLLLIGLGVIIYLVLQKNSGSR